MVDQLQHYNDLISEAEGILQNPKDRLHMAETMYAFACDVNDPQLKLNALSETVKLDPFKKRYILSLARAKSNYGLHEEALSEYRQAQKNWPESQEINLYMGETLLDLGNTGEAKKCFTKITQNGSMKVRKLYNLMECSLREAKEEKDWKIILEELQKIEKNTSEHFENTGIFYEKCLKAIMECNNPTLREKFYALAKKKAATGDKKHPAFKLLSQISGFKPQDGLGPPKQHKPSSKSNGYLEGLIKAYMFKQENSLEGKDLESRTSKIKDWQTALETYQDKWPGLQDAYISELGQWAGEAYQEHSFALAANLWNEAERLAPYDPAVIQNQAINNTRLEDDKNHHWYWNNLTQIWTMYSEMMPAAEGYTQKLIQKHQAFIEGAQEKLVTCKDNQELLELGEIWAKEAISYFTLKQLQHHNPFFICGILNSDYTSPDDYNRVIDISYCSMQKWLKLTADWQNMGENSSLAEWREKVLAKAHRKLSEKQPDRYKFYDEEKEEFLRYREYLVSQYVHLFLRVMLPASNKLNFEIQFVRNRFKNIAKCLLSFPHDLLKPAVLKIVKDLKPEMDLQQLVENHAIGPWWQKAQELMGEKNTKQAAIYLEEMLEITPESSIGFFYLAQCRFADEEFDVTMEHLEKAAKYCKEPELKKQIDDFIEYADNTRVNKRLKEARKLLESRKFSQAINECKKALADYPGHPVIYFNMAQAYQYNFEFKDAHKSFESAWEKSKIGSELFGAIQQSLVKFNTTGSQIILNNAVAKMNDKNWVEAKEILKKGDELNPPDPKIKYYEAICCARMGELDRAEKAGKAALRATHKKEEKEEKYTDHIKGILDKRLELSKPKKVPKTNDKKRKEHDSYVAAEITPIREAHLISKIKHEDPELVELRDEINGFLKQIPMIAIADEMENANKEMQNENWRKALVHLDKALKKSPDTLTTLFYKALCHFRLEEWDAAKRVAKQTLRLCGSEDDNIKEQLNIIIKNVDHLRERESLKPIEKAIKEEEWQEGLTLINNYLEERRKLIDKEVKKLYENRSLEFSLGSIRLKDSFSQFEPASLLYNPVRSIEPWETPTILFYKALCQFRLDQYDFAKETAQIALDEIKKDKSGNDNHIKDQLEQIVKATSVPAWKKDMNNAVQEINSSNWDRAISYLDDVIRQVDDAQAYYYRALAKFQRTMGEINRSSPLSQHEAKDFSQQLMEPFKDLMEAEKYNKPKNQDLASGIDTLKTSMGNVFGQLNP